MPKICGNTRQYHLTALLAALLAIACGEEASTEQFREIRAHWLPRCAPPEGSSTARLDLQALGDFDPSPDTYEELDADVVEARSVFPAETRAVLMRADNGFARWRGIAGARPAGDVNVALWPVGESCTLFEDVEDGSFMADGGGAGIGYSPSTSTLLVTDGGASAMTIDLGTGDVRQVPGEDGPRTARFEPNVAPFGADLLVSGGSDPDTGDILDSADVFRTATGRFETRLELSSPRHHHSALQLASGETLLVGGADATVRPLRQLEAVSPETLRYRISGLARLAAGRLVPSVLRLSSGEILVAGGVDENGEDVTLLEWLDPTASRVVRTRDLSDVALPASHRAFAAMPGGGALAAGGCERRLPAADEAAACNDACGSSGGCPSFDVLWILPDGAVVKLDTPLDTAAPIASLVEGAGGRPWLVADRRWALSGPPLSSTGEHPPPVVRVFDPFRGRFEAPTSTLIPESQFLHITPLAVDPGLFLWLAAGESPAFIRGFRHGTRGPFSAAVEPLLLQNRDGVSPDRPLAGPQSAGGVTLDDPELRLVLTDTSYETLRLTVITSSGPPPVVELGGREYGGDDCEWPAPTESGPLTLIRTGNTVTLEHDGRTRDCEGPEGRVTVSLRAPESVSIVSVAVQRSAD